MVFGVENFVRDFSGGEEPGKGFGFIDVDGSDEYGLASLV